MEWRAVVDHLETGHGARARADGALVVGVGSAEVRLRLLDLDGEPWVESWIDVARAGEVDPLVVTFHNIGIPIGALALQGDEVVLTQTLPAEALCLEDVDEVIHYFATIVPALRRVLLAPPPDAAAAYLGVT